MSQPRHLLGLTSIIATLGLNFNPALAQIIPDATLPNSSLAIPTSNGIRIEGGTQIGGNLFHSFSEFSIPTHTEAFFNNSFNTQNIFSRITGNNPSQIDGLIRANSQANLFLINPNGIVFGSNAQLNIGGSLFASTANRILFNNNREFSATHPNATPLLTLNVPIGLQFDPLPPNESNAGVIRVQGSGHNFGFSRVTGGLERNAIAGGLVVPSGQTLALVGRAIALDGGNLKAESGTIELRSVTSGLMLIEESNATFSFPTQQPLIELGNIQLSGAASVDTSGVQGGLLQIQSRNLRLEQGSVIVSVTEGLQPGKTTNIHATDTIELMGRTGDGRIGSSFLVQTNGKGQGGDLAITTDRLRLQDGAAIAMGTDRSGNSGNLQVQATRIELGGLSANGLRLTGIFSNPTIASTGTGGDVNLEANQLLMENGAVISVSTFGAGQSGSITIKADDVQIRGTSATGGIGSGFYARTTPPSDANLRSQLTGNAGNVTVMANRLSLENGARINVANLGKGNAGNINIRAATVELDGQALITATQRQAEQGNITIQAQNLQLRRNSTITTNASNTIVLDTGLEITSNDSSTDGGNIMINTNLLVALDNSDLTANAQQGFGGRLRINASGIFRSSDSDITATSSRGAEFSGIVQIDTPEVSLSTGLFELPENLTDVSRQIAQGCADSNGSSFAVTGRGGLPEDPNQTLLGSTIWRDLRSRPRQVSRVAPPLMTASRTPIVEATGWMRNSQGEVELVAKSPDAVSQNAWNHTFACGSF